MKLSQMVMIPAIALGSTAAVAREGARDLSQGIDCVMSRDTMNLRPTASGSANAVISLQLISENSLETYFAAVVTDGGRFLKLDLSGSRGFILIDTEGLAKGRAKAQLVWEGLSGSKKGYEEFTCRNHAGSGF